jgi:hypothetical protein
MLKTHHSGGLTAGGWEKEHTAKQLLMAAINAGVTLLLRDIWDIRGDFASLHMLTKTNSRPVLLTGHLSVMRDI